MIVRRNKICSLGLILKILRYIISTSIRNKDYITLFENSISDYLGIEYAALVCSGRKGLECILNYYSFPEGSQIIMPAYTLKDLPIMIRAMGYVPVFVDIEKDTCNMDASLIEKKFTDKTVLIVATHLFGLPCRIDKIMDIAKRKGIKVVEDCAHSLGATYRDRKLGTFADAAFFSLEVTKPINTFGGGIVVAKDKKMYDFIKESTSDYPCPRKKLLIKIATACIEDIIIHSPLYSLLGFLFYFKHTKELFSNLYRGAHGSVRLTNARYSNFQAFLGYKSILELDKKNRLFVNKVNRFRAMLSEEIKYPTADYNCSWSFYFNLIKTRYDCEKIRKKLLKAGIDVGIKDELSDNCPLYFKSEGKYPNTNIVYNSLIQMPMSFEFNERNIAKIAGKLNKIISDYS